MIGSRLTGPPLVVLFTVALTNVACDRPVNEPPSNPPPEALVLHPTTSAEPTQEKNEKEETSQALITMDPLLIKIVSTINRFHYLQPEQNEIIGKLNSLESVSVYLSSLDPYSNLVTKEYLQFTKNRAKLTRTGPGIDYLFDDNLVLAVPVFDAPLYQSGQTTAAILESINDRPISLDSFSDYRFLGLFQTGDDVEIKIKNSPDSNPLLLTISAKPYANPPLRFYTYGESTIIEIRKFRSGFSDILKMALGNARHSKRLVFDLRFSPGGDIYAMTDWLSLLLPADKIVSTLHRRTIRNPVELKTLSGRMNPDIPIIILTSRFTASSAEIFAHVLSHYIDTATVVGEPGKGKCLAQENFAVDAELSLNLSSYEIILPNGVNCENNSLTPDIAITNVALQNLAAIFGNINDPNFDNGKHTKTPKR